MTSAPTFFSRTKGLVVLAAAAGLALTGCSSSSTTPEAPEAPAAVIEAPAALAASGTIKYCATLDNPPRASVDANGKQVGFEVDLGEEIAALMGLKVTWLQLTFDGLISTLQADQCDAIVQELFIKPERLEIIDMVPFSNSGQQIVLAAGSPLASPTLSLKDLSGVKVGVPNGTTVHNLALEANEALKAEGKKEIDLVVLPTTTDTFLQLQSGTIEAVGTTTTAAAYYSLQSPGAFQVSGPVFGAIQTGIGVKKGNDEVFAAIEAAFNHIVETGKYDELIAKWKLEGSEL